MRFENKDDGYASPRRPAFTPPSRVDLRDQKFESGPPPAESPLRTQKAGVLHSDFCEFIALGSVGPRLTFLRVHGDQALQSPSLHPVLSAWLGMIGNMAMGRWAVARRTRTATPRLKRSCCRPFHIRCNPATFSDSVATDPTRWRPDTRWTDPIFSRIRTGRVPVWAARGYGPMD